MLQRHLCCRNTTLLIGEYSDDSLRGGKSGPSPNKAGPATATKHVGQRTKMVVSVALRLVTKAVCQLVGGGRDEAAGRGEGLR